MFTTAITITFLCLISFELIVILAIDGMMDYEKLSHFIFFKKLIKSIVIIEFVVFNFLFSFIHPQFVYQVFLQIVGNVVALIFFFIDYFYFSERTRSYILWMQGIVFDKTSFKKVFKVIEADGAKYKELKKVPQQMFYLVDAGKDKGECIYIPSKEGGLLLKPIKEMDHNTLMFYAQKIEIDIEKNKSLRFYKGNLPSEAIEEFDYGVESKIYLWIKNKLLSEKGKTIMVLSLLGIFALLFISFVIVNQFLNFDFINDWFLKEL